MADGTAATPDGHQPPAGWSAHVGSGRLQVGARKQGAYLDRRTAQGKSRRGVKRCLRRVVARQLFRLLERYDRCGVEILRAAWQHIAASAPPGPRLPGRPSLIRPSLAGTPRPR
jgi:hypothetical protein